MSAELCRSCRGTGYVYKDCLIHSLGVKPCPECRDGRVSEQSFMDYMNGWRDAAGARPIPPEMNANGHYNQGWKDGRDAKRKAYLDACKYYGKEPVYVRPTEPQPHE